jgi:hypothetical protein
MPLYERFGISHAGVDPKMQLETMDTSDAVACGNMDAGSALFMLANGMGVVALRYYLMDDLVNAKKFAVGMLDVARDYFFGDWRARVTTEDHIIDPDLWHDKESWMDVYDLSLFWGSVLGRWDWLKEISAYPDDDRSMERGDTNAALRRLYIEITRHIRGENAGGSVAKKIVRLDGANWRGNNFIASCLDAIRAHDAAAADESLNAFFAAHAKRKRSKQITDTVSPLGTFMMNLAAHQNVRVNLRPEFSIYYVKL